MAWLGIRVTTRLSGVPVSASLALSVTSTPCGDASSTSERELRPGGGIEKGVGGFGVRCLVGRRESVAAVVRRPSAGRKEVRPTSSTRYARDTRYTRDVRHARDVRDARDTRYTRDMGAAHLERAVGRSLSPATLIVISAGADVSENSSMLIV